jgi:hypothetical protein
MNGLIINRGLGDEQDHPVAYDFSYFVEFISGITCRTRRRDYQSVYFHPRVKQPSQISPCGTSIPTFKKTQVE